MSPVRVVVVDDHPLFREGVAASLANSGHFTVVGQGGSADEAVRLVQDLSPEMVLLDLSMPGGGLSAAREIAAIAPGARIVVLTVSEDDDNVLQALQAGAKGYVLKGVGSTALVEILKGIAKGESYVSPSLAARILTEMRGREPNRPQDNPLAALTAREEEILRLVATGQSNKQVALSLDLQEKTIKHHMTRILSKLQVRNRTEAAILLREREPRRQ
ncbi:MAG TPA: response regulator transcription factor [Propylenella sp.]|jgi:DNA-binding NarL/FixJ family response regulator